ncbi:AI-2E family transporter [Methylocaldum sp.]|uniref:AI-2E family transporter n=1 Tax=Methylocaldum sp. TaxID=1969727 RepID=UPI002D708F55|nr:AI-2E family transporter [Methylocaldum sp.]HYE33844.1 AI-2E family transporter [Methylocaldum sp.]
MANLNKCMVVAGILGAGWLIYLLAPILTPFVAGALVAYLSDPLADRLESLGLKRQNAVIVVFAVIIFAISLVLLLIIPMLEEQINRFIDNLPAYSRWFRATVIPWAQKHLGIRIKFVDLEQLAGMLSAHWQQAGGVATTVLSSLSRSGAVVISWLMNLVLIPVVIFYLLRDWDVIVAQVNGLLPRRWAPDITMLAAESDEVLSAVFRGQFAVMAALGTIYSVGLWLVGLDLALLIGMFSGLISFIPYAGSISGVVAASIAALTQFGDLWSVVPVLAVFGVGQMLEGVWLTPWLVGNKIGLHPVAVIFAVLAGGQLFGFLGVLLALPVASVIMVLMRHIHSLYKSSDLYGDDVSGEDSESLGDRS